VRPTLGVQAPAWGGACARPWTAACLRRDDERMKKTRPDRRSMVSAVAELHAAATEAQESSRRKAEALIANIARRMDRFAESFYEVGVALKELLEKKLHLALGYASFKEMLATRDVLGLTRAKQLLRVVETMDRETALQLGLEKAYALARYTAATPEEDTPAGLLAAGALVGGKPAGEATLREIQRATRDVRRKTAPTKAKDPEEKGAEDARQALSAWLVRRRVKGAEVEIRRRKGGLRIVVELGADQVRKVVGGA